jgi:hypothetical protein
MSDDGIGADKAAALRLRARLAVVERAAWFGLVHAMRTRPAETEAYITSERARCTEGFGSGAWAKDLTDAERKRWIPGWRSCWRMRAGRCEAPSSMTPSVITSAAR